MKYIEELLWILDDDKIDTKDEGIKKRIEFAHSLGLKCDSVGWSKLNLSNPHTDQILDSISSFCKKNRLKARGIYNREYIELKSDWYELVPAYFNNDVVSDFSTYETVQGRNKKMINIQAYREIKISPKRWGEDIFVPERFRNVCIKHNVTDVDFCWVNDKGKYEAEQYFKMYGINQIPRIVEFNYHDSNFTKNIFESIKRKKERKVLNTMDGSLPRLAKIFHTLQQINLPVCYLENDIPDCNIVQAYTSRTNFYCGRNIFLIHKKFAKVLLQEKVLPESALRPALIVKEIPQGYILKKTDKNDFPTLEYKNKSIEYYKKIKNVVRPKRIINESEALKIFRKTKNERKEDFKDKISKTNSLTVGKTKYAPLVSFYLISNGGYLSDEYELLSYDNACIENELFAKEINKEELFEDKVEGIVFAMCGDGDRIILCDTGKVVRFSHEDLSIINEWLSLSSFIIDALNN